MNTFESIVSAKAVGAADVAAQAEALRKLSESIDGLATKANKVNDHPGFGAFAAKVKQGLSDPLGSIGAAAESALKALGPVGTGAAAIGATLAAAGVAGLSFARDLGHLGDEISDTAVRMGLTIREVGQFRFAMAYAGGDMGSLQGIMRKLSQEIDEGGKNLRAAGIEFRNVSTGEVRPMSEIILELSQRFGAMTSVTERNALAVKILGKSALEVLPDLLELNEGVKRARELGLGPTEEDVSRWNSYQRQMAEVDAQWEQLKRKVKEPLAATVLVVLKTINESQVKGNISGFGSGAIPADGWVKDPLVSALMGSNLFAPSADLAPMLMRTSDATRRAISRNDDQVVAALLGTDEDQLAAAKKKLQDLRNSLKTGVLPEVNEQTFQQVDAQKAIVTAIEARIEATKKLEAAEKSLLAFEQQMAERDLGPVAKIFAQRDKLVREGANAGRATDAALTGASSELAKEISDDQRRSFEMAVKAGATAQAQWEEVYKSLDKSSDRLAKDFRDAVEAARTAAREVLNAQFAVDRAAADHEARLLSANAMPGQETAALREALALRIAAAENEFRIKESHGELYNIDKERWSLQREMQDAAFQFEEHIAQVRRQRLEEFRSFYASAFDAVMGGKQGVSRFIEDFFRSTARSVVANTLTALQAGQKLDRGSIFAGTLLAPDQTAGVKLSGAGDRLNIAASELISAARVLAMSPSGGGGGSIGNFASRVGGALDVFDEAGIESGSLPTDGRWGDVAGEFSGGKFNFGRAAGLAALSAGGGFAVYNALRQGGSKGAVNAAGSALSAIGSIASLASKAAAWAGPAGLIAGMGLNLISSFLPDPKQERAMQIDRMLESARYSAPDPRTYTTDRFGRSFDYNTMGQIRINVETPIVVNTVDSEGWARHKTSIAEAHASALEEHLSPRLEAAMRRTIFR